ncbi:hypothetical protein NEOC65_002247 [Neochlamydia sp. AcF65]|nr:hypothetical protein [Neochlamydia sp. AcF65]MBS4169453.1 hypothetical protein [Neochlamydia sp. AcF95]NGY95594.1 hypothetical protein [Neochlamydia sp. AcF84]
MFLNVQGISFFALKVNIDFFFKSSLGRKKRRAFKLLILKELKRIKKPFFSYL